MLLRWALLFVLSGPQAVWGEGVERQDGLFAEARGVLRDAVDRQVAGSAVGLVAVRQRGKNRNVVLLRRGGLRSTVLDYHRFLLMILNDGELDGVRVVRPETVQLMTINHVGSRFGAGFGWGMADPGSGMIAGREPRASAICGARS